ncbi:MAG: ATP-binding cassette domain-containing protein [Actinobacteria bacterium]|nr:MAG: ATP-binding cassette domain-containing protein [Actinomycetota bacterium]
MTESYGGRVAVDGLNLDVRAGEVVGLIGANGAGKTRTVECLQDLRVADTGVPRDRRSPHISPQSALFAAVQARPGLAARAASQPRPTVMNQGERWWTNGAPLPRWGSRVRIPSSALERGSLTCGFYFRVELSGNAARKAGRADSGCAREALLNR